MLSLTCLAMVVSAAKIADITSTGRDEHRNIVTDSRSKDQFIPDEEDRAEVINIYINKGSQEEDGYDVKTFNGYDDATTNEPKPVASGWLGYGWEGPKRNPSWF